MTLPELPDVWEQYPGETTADYALFLTYIEQGVARSIASAARSAAGYSYSYVNRLAKAWLWAERAEAWDLEQNTARVANLQRLEETKRERWSHDQLELAELTTQLLRDELIALRKAQADGRRLPPTALAQLMDRLHKWMQISTGGITDNVGQQFSLEGLDQQSRDLLQSEAVRQALDKIARG